MHRMKGLFGLLALIGMLCACTPRVETVVLVITATPAVSSTSAPRGEPPGPAALLSIPSPTAIPASPATDVPSVAEEIVEAAAVEEVIDVPTSTPVPTRQPPPTATPTRTPRPLTAEDAAPCQVGQIKGNRSSHIYHVPRGASYARTKARVDCFDSEDEAQAAGYRR